ncbi:MAG: hypothetical protein JSU65_06105 [Candidatus Zixiibacteriota bacterium]|nr:MAG: hypothetical protein JSU65_06105 [candidate division Zixibacteria bacterium]
MTATGLLLIAAAGCGPGYTPRVDQERSTEELEPEKIRADAFLYDARLWRKGKPTSVRLELYQTDTLIALAGRAYLGKGALKGRLTTDSLLLYFPTRDEYVYEAVEDIATGTDCPFSLGDLSLGDLLQNLPDSLPTNSSIEMLSDYSNRNKPEFRIFRPLCDWEINLTYDRKKGRFLLRKFEFTDGKQLRLKATRREFRQAARVPVRRFDVEIPSRAMRILP